MPHTIRIIVEGDFACFTRPEFKVERVSYDVPTPGSLEGMLKSIHWKPAIRYCIDKIIVYNPINFISIKRNELKEKVLISKVKSQMEGKGGDPSIYTSEMHTQKSSMILKNVRYGVEFHIEMTGLRSEGPNETAEKHRNMITRRIRHGQFHNIPYLGCREFSVKDIKLVDEFPENTAFKGTGDVDLGYMLYHMVFKDHGVPVNNDWEHPIFSDEADALYYRPHMINGVIDTARYKEGTTC